MLLRQLTTSSSLLRSLRYSALIYLRDHNKLITPQNTQLKLSHLHPKNLVPGAPSQPKIEFKLAPQKEEELERQIFEEYKKKILTGTIDAVEEKAVDEIWGEDEPPVHYYHRIGKQDLMGVSHPQRHALEPTLESIYSAPFATPHSHPVTLEEISRANPHQLVQVCLRARHQGVDDAKMWWAIEEGFERGMVFHKLSPQELISIKWAFCGRRKFGTPQFHTVLADLLREDLPSMDHHQMVSLFYACWHSNAGRTSLQHDILNALTPHYSSFTFEEKANFLLLFTMSTQKLRYEKRVQKRRRDEYRDLARSVLFRLDIWDMPLTDELASRMIYALAKLRLPNTKWLTLPIVEHIREHWESFVGDAERCMLANVYLPEVEDCEGVVGQDTLGELRAAAEAHWQEYSPIDKMRMVHSWWNMGLMDEALMELYQGIELEVDSTLLNLACQIQLGSSSGREWQIVQLLAELPILPLPYFTAYKRFYNYLANTTEWNLTPLKDKLLNTEYYHNCLRQNDSLLSNPIYSGFLEFEKFTGAKLATTVCPIGNLELTQFAHANLQISLDFVPKREMITGTSQPKESYMNKVRSLQNIGWKHLGFGWEEASKSSLLDVIKNVQDMHEGFEEEQQAVIDYADYQQMKYIEHVKTEEMLNQLDIKYVNFLLFPDEVKEDIDPEDQFYQLPSEEDEEGQQAVGGQ